MADWDLLFRSAFLHDAPADGERLDANGARTAGNSIHKVFSEAEELPLASRAGIHIELIGFPCADIIQYPGGIVTLDMELYKYADAKQARAIYAGSRTGPVLLDFGDIRAIIMPVRHGKLDDIRQRVLDFIANDTNEREE